MNGVQDNNRQGFASNAATAHPAQVPADMADDKPSSPEPQPPKSEAGSSPPLPQLSSASSLPEANEPSLANRRIEPEPEPEAPVSAVGLSDRAPAAIAAPVTTASEATPATTGDREMLDAPPPLTKSSREREDDDMSPRSPKRAKINGGTGSTEFKVPELPQHAAVAQTVNGTGHAASADPAAPPTSTPSVPNCRSGVSTPERSRLPNRDFFSTASRT